MAKKKKIREEKEKIEFKLPKFDEKKFIKKEKRNIKTTFISFLFGIIIAIISYFIWTNLSVDLRWPLVLLFALFSASWLKYIFVKLNIDLTDFGNKGWANTILVYFFTWLLLLIVLCNPPFYDDAPPYIEVVALPGVQELGGTVKIVARIVDNVGIKDVNFSITNLQNGNTTYPNVSIDENNILSYTFVNSDDHIGEFKYNIVAKDVNNHISRKNGTFRYDNYAIVLTMPANGSTLYSYTPIEFRVNEDVSSENFRTYYKVNNGPEINVSRANEKDKTIYRSTPEYKGWPRNENVTLKAYVEVIYYFTNMNKKFNNTIEDTTTYYFKTADDPNIGTKERLIPKDPYKSEQPKNTLNYYLPYYKPTQTPGFGLIALIVAFLIVILIFKNKKKK
jgi:heme/copper-type cytochrome/quinol oxidase subunit 4